MFLIPEAQWLLCIWQARQARAPWWAVFIIILSVQLSKILLEKLASFNPEEDNITTDKKKGSAGWPELLRAAVGITVSVYVVQQILIDIFAVGQNGVTAIVVSLVILSGVLDYQMPTSWLFYAFIFIMTFTGVLWKEWGAPAKFSSSGTPSEWLQLLLSAHALSVGHVVPLVSNKHNYYVLERLLPLFCVIVFATQEAQPHKNAVQFLFLLLPSIFLKEKHAVTVCITPILDQVCHSGLYPLQDPKKTEARNVLLMQQKQEILIYIVTWCVVMGLWAHTRPSVLLWVQIAGGVLYLASLRRYANVVRILNFRHTVYHRPPHNEDKPANTRRKGPSPPQDPHLQILNKLMALPSRQ